MESLKSGTFYQIICKMTQMALKMEQIQNHENSRIIDEKINTQDITQIWLLQKIKDNQFEIVNALSDLVITSSKSEVRLKKGEQSNSQLFQVQKAKTDTYYQYYWFRNKKDSKALTYQGFLRIKNFDINDESQLFRLEIVNDNQMISKTVLIVNNKSNKVLDVPGGSQEKGAKIIQYDGNDRFNQRWNIIKYKNGYQINNFKSRLNLDICEESHTLNTEVIQWTPTGATNQLWTFQKRGENLYTIRSIHQKKLVLGILFDSVENGGRVAVVQHDTVWRIENLNLN